MFGDIFLIEIRVVCAKEKQAFSHPREQSYSFAVSWPCDFILVNGNRSKLVVLERFFSITWDWWEEIPLPFSGLRWSACDGWHCCSHPVPRKEDSPDSLRMAKEKDGNQVGPRRHPWAAGFTCLGLLHLPTACCVSKQPFTCPAAFRWSSFQLIPCGSLCPRICTYSSCETQDTWLALTKELWAAWWGTSGEKRQGPACGWPGPLPLPLWLGKHAEIEPLPTWFSLAAGPSGPFHDARVVWARNELGHFKLLELVVIVVTRDKSSLFWQENILKAVVTNNSEVKAKAWGAEA